MLIHQRKKDDLEISIFESSNILSSEYNYNDGNLKVKFKGGRAYTYGDVSKTDYMRFQIAESQGKVLNKLIKTKYEATRSDDFNVNDHEILVENLRTEERVKLMNEVKGEWASLMDASTLTHFELKNVNNLIDLLRIYQERYE